MTTLCGTSPACPVNGQAQTRVGPEERELSNGAHKLHTFGRISDEKSGQSRVV
jgi:hypothetical protein